jgi:protein ImuB
MRVPSYDDLAPGIPDVSETRLDEQLALFLGRVTTPDVQIPTPKQLPTRNSPIGNWELGLGNCHPLYACLRAEAAAEKLAAIARDFSPRIMRVSAGEVLLDVSGLGRLIGDPPAIAAALAQAIVEAGLAGTARVALAPTQTAARLLAMAAGPERSGLQDPMSRLPDLPVAFLQPLETVPPAMNHRDRARPSETRDAKRLYEILARWGIVTLGDLAALPAAGLSSRLGRRGVALQRLARGLDARPFVPDGETPRFIGRLELEWPIDTLEPLSFVFARLLEPLSAALERADRGAAAIRLDLRLTSRETLTRVLQLPAPMRDPKVLRTLLLLDLESPLSPLRGFPPSPANAGFGGTGGETSAVTVTVAVDAVSIELDPAPARITQFSLLERAMPSPETLSTLTARLSALVGESRIGSPVLLDSHRPDSFAMTGFAPESRGAKGANGARGANGAGANGAEGANGAVLRRQRIPPAIRVRVEQGRPVYIAVARRGMPHGIVMQAAGPWRTCGGWWSGKWSRDEWDIALSSGAVCRIFQDRTTERWFLEGIYD